MGWILLLAALAQPGWAVAHALGHSHLEQHHSAHVLAALETHAGHPACNEKTPHDHGHLDDALIVASRGTNALQFEALPAASPSTVAAAEPPGRIVRERALPLAGPELTGPSHPRAPPLS